MTKGITEQANVFFVEGMKVRLSGYDQSQVLKEVCR